MVSTDEDRSNINNSIHRIQRNKCSELPKIIWLLENPNSLIALPGKISLYNHDSLHLLLNRDTDSIGEAFVLGFTMGNDLSSRKHHVLIFKFFLRFIYPASYRLSKLDLEIFDLGLRYGRKIKHKNINQADFKQIEKYPLALIRNFLGINIDEIKCVIEQRCFQYNEMYSNSKKSKPDLKNYINFIKIISSISAISGGFWLALNVKSSSYGFIPLAISSFSLFLSAILDRDRLLIFYSGSVFFSVDLLGIYRWILAS